jgi:ubiquinone biosynthesis protein
MAIGLHPVRHLRRYQHIGATFMRHGFGFAINQLQPAVRNRLRRRSTVPVQVPTEALAEHFRMALQELGPTFVKFGQVLSTRPDLLPPEYITELSRLQDAVPPEPWEDIRAVLTAELSKAPEEVFATIDPLPIAAASLSQVHLATLRDGDGCQVVVKVQRPGVREQIETDLSILAELANGAQHTPIARYYDLPAIVDEFAYTLRNELDYVREGRSADRFRENFEEMPGVYFPRVYWGHTTRRVLTMERLEGIKIDDIAAMDAAKVDRKTIALHSAEIIVKEVLEDGFFHADPHPGNFLVMSGNIIGAMDFGMVGHVDEALRLDLIRLYAAAVDVDANAVVDQLIRMGAVDEEVNRRRLSTDIRRFLDRYRGVTLEELRADEMFADIVPIAFRHHIRLPADLWLLGKTLSMIEGVGRRLDPEFDMFAVSEPIVRRLIRRLLIPNAPKGRTLIRLGTDWADVTTLLPRAASRVLQQAERGDLFSVRVKDMDHFLFVMDRLATRLTLAVLVAGLTVGLAVLIPATTGNVLARVMAVLGFLVSATLAVWIVISMLRSGRH